MYKTWLLLGFEGVLIFNDVMFGVEWLPITQFY